MKDKISLSNLYLPESAVNPVSIIRNLLFARKAKADIFHITGDIHYVALALPGKKTILTVHDCVFLKYKKGLKRFVLFLLYLKWPVKKCSVITTISEKSKQDIVQFTGCNPEKIVVIPDPVGSHFYFQPKTFNATCPVLLFVGITPNKNLFRVIEAIKDIPCVLDIIGKIPSAERELLNNNKVRYSESINLTEEELAAKYASADIVLFPSLFEGFGLPIVEGNKSGRPVITSNLPPMNAVAGDSACLVDPNSVDSIRQGILQVISDNAYREQLVQKGTGNVKRFQAETIALNYNDLYTKLLIRKDNI